MTFLRLVSPRRAAASPDPSGDRSLGGLVPRPPGWNSLRQLVLGRILVASLALPSGLLLRPDVTSRPLSLLALAMGSVAGVSVAWTLGGRLARGLKLQTAAQLGVDLALVTWLAAYTGGRGSQFVLFYALVVITGGVLGRVTGGLLTATGACTGFLLLPTLAAPLGGGDGNVDALIKPELMVTFLTIVGVLAGVLGERVQRTAGDLERTERELDRVRVDNDAILRHLATGISSSSASQSVSTAKHPKVSGWPGRHARFHSPTCDSWLNARRLKRGVFNGVADLQAAINRFLQETNARPKPLI